MGRRRTQRACATIPSMLSSARGAPELRPRAAADAEVSAASAAVTGSEVVRLGDRGGRNRGGRVAAATTSSTRVTEGAERRGHSPARKPDPEPGRMDHHQPGTGRYQVVSFWPQPGPPAPPRTPGLPPAVAPRVPFLGLFAEWTCWLIYFLPLLAGPCFLHTSRMEPACGSFETFFFQTPVSFEVPIPPLLDTPTPPFKTCICFMSHFLDHFVLP